MLPPYIQRTPENNKILEPSLRLINSFDKITIDPVDESVKNSTDECEIKRDANRHKIYFVKGRGKLSNRNSQFSRLRVQTSLGEVILGNVRYEGVSDFVNFENSPEEVEKPAFVFSTSSITSKNFREKFQYYFRVFIPIKEFSEIPYLLAPDFYIIANTDYIGYECTTFRIKDTPYYFYSYSKDNVNYLIVESMSKESFEPFSNRCFAVLLAFGFISGNLHLDKFYYFAYKEFNKATPYSYKYIDAVRSIKTRISPTRITENMIPNKGKMAKKILSSLKNLTREQFSTLCTSLSESLTMRWIVLMLIEAGELSLNLRPSTYAIVLEAMTDFIVKEMENLDETNPSDRSRIKILRTDVAKEIRNRFNEIVDSEFFNVKDNKGNLKLVNKGYDGSDLDGYDFIKKKIGAINDPTNQAKLTKPFSMMGVEINNDDIDFIGYRNKLLHGEGPEFYGDSMQKINDRVFYITYRLYSLVCALILARIEFPYVLDYSVIYQKEHRQNTAKSIIRKLSKPLYPIP